MDSHQIAELTQRVLRQNDARLARAEAALTPAGRRVLNLLSVLLHYNHPDLPGFVSLDTPAGIANFSASDKQLSLTSELLPRSQRLHSDCLSEPTDQQLLGIYSMGSTASLGQCRESDLDIWVCYHCELGTAALESLRLKCNQLEVWAQQQDVDLNLFLVNPHQFRLGDQQMLSKENCGSAQNWLLLDEFYRTALHLAGRWVIWYLVPADQEENYPQVVQQLYDEGHVAREEWLDMGGFPRVPAEEYFGGTLWQLYKGIDSPYKAVLKTLLMEAYSSQYPQTRLLSVELKRSLHEDSQEFLALDPYFRMMKTVTEYLTSIGDESRLDLARRCFYLKTCEKLSQLTEGERDWRSSALEQLVREWGWSNRKLRHLDNRPNWKVEQVRAAYRELLDAQMLSFRKLIEFARRNKISESINPEDIGVLSRKLYSAFETLPSKVSLINPQISPDLHEPDLTFIEVPPGRKTSPGWYLYKQPLITEKIIGAAPQKHAPSLVKAMAWAYFNGVLTSDTELYLYRQNADLNLRSLHQFYQDIAARFPLKLPATTKTALTRPSEIRQLSVFVNLTDDPTRVWDGRVIDFDVRGSDALTFGPEKVCLVRSIDLLYTTSWNEIHVASFSGAQALLDAMVAVTTRLNRLSDVPTDIDVLCYSHHFSSQIRRRVGDLFREAINHRTDSAARRTHFMSIPIGNEKYGLLFEPKGVSKQRMQNSIDFYSRLSESKLKGMTVKLDNSAPIDPPEVVEHHASEGLVQFFFEAGEGGINIYVVDENNRVEAYQHFQGDKEELVQSVNRFYTSTHDRFTISPGYINFNLPQYYEIVEVNGQQQVLPYSSCTETAETEINQAM